MYRCAYSTGLIQHRGTGQHHASTNIAESGKFFYIECLMWNLSTKLLVTSCSEKFENRSIASQYFKELFEAAFPALPACFVMLQADESHRQYNLS